jgi:PAS domain S-box-containing protein
MKDNQKTKKQLIDELDMLRQKMAARELASNQSLATGLRDTPLTQQEGKAAILKQKEGGSHEEEKLNLIIEEAGLTSWEWDIEHDRKVFNAIWAKHLGYTLEEFNSALQGYSLDHFQHPEDIPVAQQAMKDYLAGKAPLYRAEYRMRTKTGDWKWMLALGKIVERNAEGRPTHMTGVNIDINERKQAEEAHRESEAKYRALIEAIPDKIVLYRKDGTHLDVKIAKDYIATTQHDLDNRANISQINPELAPRVLSCLQQAVETGKTQILEYESMRGDEREYREARYAAINQNEIVAIIRDITGPKRAENALQLTQFTMDHAVDSIFWVRDDARFVYVNDSACRHLGYSRQELLSMRVFDIDTNFSKENWGTHWKDLKQRGNTIFETTHRTKDGKEKLVEVAANFMQFEGVTFLCSFIRDITERMRMEQLQQTSENKYRLLVDNANEAIFVVQDGMLKFANHMTSEISGYPEQELTSRPFPMFIHPDDRDMVVERHLRRLKGEDFQSRYPFRLITSNGSVKWVEIGAVLIDWEDKPATLNFISDITERKLAEQALQQANERLQATLNALPDLMFEVDREGRFHDYRVPHSDLLYVPPEVFLGKTVSQVLPKEAADISSQAIAQAVEEGRHRGATYSLEMPEGLKWFELSIASKGDPKAPDGRLIVLAHDITERKQVEQALLESEKKLKDAQAIARFGSWEFDVESQAITWSDQTYRLYNRDPAMGPPTSEEEAGYYSPEQGQALHEYARRAIKEGKNFEYDLEAKLPGGKRAYFLATMRPVKDNYGRVVKLFGTVQDITERKHAEEALKKSEGRFRSYFELPIIGIAITSADKSWIEVNDYLCDLMGYTSEELIQKGWIELTHPEDLNADLDQFNRVLAGEIDGYSLDKRFIRKDGETIWTSISTRCVRLSDGSVGYFVDVVLDITERRRMEEALRQSEERYRLLAETSPDMIFVVNTDFKVTYVNNIGARSLGRQMADIIGNRVENFFPVESARRQVNNLRQVFETGQPFYSENTNVFQGKTLCLDTWLVPIKDAGGSIVLVMGVSRDITERKQVEEALHESEARFRTLIEESPIAISLARSGRIIYSNPKYAQMFGYQRAEELTGQFISDLYAPQSREKIKEISRRRDRGESAPTEYEVVGQRKDGTQFIVHVSVAAVELADGRAYIGFLTDITERKRMEEALRQSEERFRTLVENIPGEVYRCLPTRPWQIIHNSAEIETINGHLVSDFLNGSLIYSDFIVAEDLEMVNSALEAGIARKKPFIIEYRIHHADGSIHWVEERGRAVYSEQGEPQWLDGVIFDITERKRLEQELIDRERSYHTLVENIPGAVYRCEPVPPWWTIHTSSEIEVISGFPTKDFLDKSIPFDWLIYPEDVERVNRAMLTAIADKKPYVSEYRIHHADGSIHWLYEKGRAIYSEQEQPLWLDGIFIDITERKQAEEALRDTQKLASMGALAAGMAHEINSPLQVITGMTERIATQLESGQLDESWLKRDIATINRSGWNIANIVRSLLTYARESPGRLAFHNLNEIVKDTLLLTEHQLRTWSNINVVSDLGKNLPSLYCEHNQIVQVLINLLTNARDAMPNGGKITIRTRYNAKRNRVVLQVSDTGIGIPKEMQEKIFDPFFTTKPVDQGIGLGLSIVFGIVKAHGGDIEVKSALKQGTTFTIYLPSEPVRKPDSEPLMEIKGRF